MQPSNPESKRKTIAWQSKGLSHRGKTRQHNEDAFLDRPEQGLWAVADGMGGHAAGDVASRMVIEQLATLPDIADLETLVDACVNRLRTANDELFARGSQNSGRIMGSTVVVMLSRGHRGAIVWAGDSRAYRLRENQMLQLTQDHSRVMDLVNQGILAAQDAERHPDANIITRAVGVSAQLEVDVQWLDIQTKDVYLLCSDGLYRYLDLASLQIIMSALSAANDERSAVDTKVEQPSCTSVAQRLLASALASPARDNITALVSQPQVTDITLTTEVNPLRQSRIDEITETEDEDPTETQLAQLMSGSHLYPSHRLDTHTLGSGLLESGATEHHSASLHRVS